MRDYFIATFGMNEAGPLLFRFEKFGTTINERDFVDPDNPADRGLAQESFSDIVNRLAAEDAEEVSVVFGSGLIDSEYKRLLGASLPFTSEADPYREQITQALIELKANGEREWARYSTPRRGAIPDDYRASFANPSSWYDRNAAENWTKHSFEIKESTGPLNEDSPKAKLWRFRLLDAELREALPSLANEHAAAFELRRDVMRRRPMVAFARRLGTGGQTTHPDPAVAAGRMAVPIPMRAAVRPALAPDLRPASEVLRAKLPKLNLKDRLDVVRYIRENAASQPSLTKRLTIQFEYCGVNIRRPWLVDGLLKSKTWFIPGSAAGEENNAKAGINLSFLPVQFVAIRNLSIEGDWSEQDMTASKSATNFGPFEVNQEISAGRLYRDGIQIIGWILERMPKLPPNDPV